MYSQWQGPRTHLRPISRPDTSDWWRPLFEPSISAKAWPLQVGAAAVVCGTLAVVAYVSLVLGLIAAIAGVASAAYAVKYMQANTVGPPKWEYEGVAIRGKAFSMLEDIDNRFRYAEKHIKELPTGIEWRDVASDVQVLLWEAAGHAARVSALDVEIADLSYANLGTPQAALRKSLQERREEYWQMLLDTQLEADELARVAGNALAAAKVALARTGSLRHLEVAAPTPQAIMARWSLSDVRARLNLLADVWAELDETTLLKQERLERGEP